MAKSKASNKKVWAARIVTAVVLIAVLLLSLIWANTIDRKLGLVKTVEETQTVESAYDGNSIDDVLTAGELGENLNVHFVDVGQGDACIIELPDNKTMLIDAGDTHKENKDKLLAYIDENIKTAENNTIDYFDYVILTHPDSDHCGGMYDVLTKYPAQKFYRPNVYASWNGFADPAKDEILASAGNSKNNIKDTVAYGKAIQAGYNAGRINGVESRVVITDATDEENRVITPENCEEGDPNWYTFTFYAPVEKSFKDWNDYSPVMILEYHEKRFMLSGDAEAEEEASFVQLAQSGEGIYSIFDENFTVDVFKLGHHGSRTSSSEAFINVMTTEENCANVIAVISCGEGNSYGHPHAEVMTRLAELGFAEKNIVRTDVNGTVAMSVKGEYDESGKAVYALFMGAETVRRTTTQSKSVAKVGNDTVQLTWKEIVLLAIVVIVIVLIVTPAVQQMRSSARKAAKAAASASRASSSGRTSSSKKNGGSRRK